MMVDGDDKGSGGGDVGGDGGDGGGDSDDDSDGDGNVMYFPFSDNGYTEKSTRVAT